MDVRPIHYQLVPPSPRLAPYVRFYRVLSAAGGGALVHRAPCFPDGNVEMVINAGAPFERSHRGGPDWQSLGRGHLLAGPAEHASALQCPGRLGGVNVSFRPGAALPFLGVPAAEVSGLWLTLDTLWRPAELRELDALGEARPGSLVAALERVLERRVGDAPAPPPVLRAALRLLERSRGRMPVRRLAAYLGTSERSLVRLFGYRVGLSPKRYARVLRFRHALRLLQDGSEGSAAALAAGYYDQAHLINEFRAITGLPPAALLRAWTHGGFFQDTGTGP